MKVFSLKACLAPLAWLHPGGSWAVSAQKDGTQWALSKAAPGGGTGARAAPLQAARAQGSHSGTPSLPSAERKHWREWFGSLQSPADFQKSSAIDFWDCASPWRTGKSPRRLPRMPVNCDSENSLVPQGPFLVEFEAKVIPPGCSPASRL